MRFWDTSALVPLLIEVAGSAACRRLLRADPKIGVWALTRTEVVSAIRRRERAAELRRREVDLVMARLALLGSRWSETRDLAAVSERAERLLADHPLRAADALQLAAALVLFDDRARDHGFVTSDGDLAAAAGREGFDVFVPGR